MLFFAVNISDYAVQLEAKRCSLWPWNDEQKDFNFLSDNFWKWGIFYLWQRLIGDRKAVYFDRWYLSAEWKELLSYFVPESVWILTK